MKRYTETVVDWMIRQKVINEKEKELYGYALYSVGLLILPLLFAVGIGFILGSIKSGIALVVPFMILRKYSGGYHAKTFLIVQSAPFYFCFCVSNFPCK